MSSNQHIKHFNAEDIRRYHRNEMTPQERHALEKAALDDPFLADALEGFSVNDANVPADIYELQERLAGRVGTASVIPINRKEEKKTYPLLRIAAMLVILTGAGLIANYFISGNSKKEIAQNPVTVGPANDHVVTGTDTTAVIVNNNSNSFSNSSAVPQIKTEKAKQEKVVSIQAPPTPVENEGITSPVTEPSANGSVASKTNPEEVNVRNEVAEARKVAAKEEGYRTQKYQQPAGVSSKNRSTDNAVNNNGYLDYSRRMNTFRGKVTDQANRGLPFANVVNLRDNVGTYTDASGNFVLTSTDSVLNVQVRSVGFDNNVAQLDNSTAMNKVVMNDDKKDLATVVVDTRKPNAEKRKREDNIKVEEPEPADGWENYDTYLSNNLNKPVDFHPKNSGADEVLVSFEVDKNGAPVNIRVEKSLCESCDQEAIRLVKEGPKWKRRAKKGRTTITVSF